MQFYPSQIKIIVKLIHQHLKRLFFKYIKTKMMFYQVLTINNDINTISFNYIFIHIYNRYEIYMNKMCNKIDKNENRNL